MYLGSGRRGDLAIPNAFGIANFAKDCFGGMLKPTPETRALPQTIALSSFNIRTCLVIRHCPESVRGQYKKKRPPRRALLRLRQIKPIGAYAVPPPIQAHPSQSGLESPARG